MPDQFRDLQSFYQSTLSQSIGPADNPIGVTAPPVVQSGYFIIEPDTVNEEIILVTAVTGNNLTVVRGLAESGSSEAAGTGLPHPASVSIINADAHFYIKRIQISKAFEYRGNYAGTAAINAITNPATGDLAIDNQTGLMYYYNGSSWVLALGANSVNDSTTTTKGVGKVSVAPVSPTSPIFVGDNDPRMPTQGENDALVGNNTSIAVGTSNKFMTQTGFRNGAETMATWSGTNTITATYSPVPAALVAGQEFWGIVAVTNTGAVTFNPNGLGAKACKKLDGATALVAGDLVAGEMAGFRYDGTNMQLIVPGATPIVHWEYISSAVLLTQPSGSTVAVPANAAFAIIIGDCSANGGNTHQQISFILGKTGAVNGNFNGKQDSSAVDQPFSAVWSGSTVTFTGGGGTASISVTAYFYT